MNEQRRDRDRPGSRGFHDDAPAGRPEPRRDAGAYIGRKPERATETIPGGVQRGDQRVSAVATQPGPVRGPIPDTTRGAPPEGHREGEAASDARVREAGQNR
jgi:hypothetical protein